MGELGWNFPWGRSIDFSFGISSCEMQQLAVGGILGWEDEVRSG